MGNKTCIHTHIHTQIHTEKTAYVMVKIHFLGISLVVQWLGLSAVTAVVWIQSLEDPKSCVAQQIKYFIKLKN